MANTKIPSELVAINAISGTLIADNAITSVHIAENNITATQIAINAVTALQMADGTITSAKIADGTIVTADIADGQITTSKIADSSVTTGKIAAGTILSSDIANNAILTQHIDDNQITADQIADNAVGLGQLASLSRGSLIYGNSAGNPAYLAAGTNGHVLTSDGTDISWTADTDLFLASSGGTVSGDIIISASTDTPLIITTTNSNGPHMRFQVDGNNKHFIGSGTGIGGMGDADDLALRAYDNIFLGTGNSSTKRVTIDSSGRVRIGATLGLNHLLNLQTASTSGLAQMEFRNTAAGTQIGMPANTNALSFFTADGERMRIDSSGKVGIGEVDPDNKLDVNFSITGEGSQDGGIKIHNVRGYDNDIAPLYFGVHGGTRRTKAAIGLKRAGAYGIGSLIFALDSNGDDANVTFANDEKMRITSAGNVGIGTTSPAEKLHVSGGHIRINNGYELRTSDTSGNVKTITRVNSSNELEYGWSGAGPVKFMGGGSYTERMRIHTNANIGIGNTDPNSTLHIGSGTNSAVTVGSESTPAFQIGGDDNYRLGMYTDSEGGYIQNKNGDNGIIFRTKTAGEVMRLNAGTGVINAWKQINIHTNDGTTNSAVNSLMITNSSTGTTTTGFGGEIRFQAERNNGVIQNTGGIISIAEINAGTNISSGLRFTTSLAGVNANALNISCHGNVTFPKQTTNFENVGFTHHTNNYLYLRGGTAGLIIGDDSGVNTVRVADGSSGYFMVETGNGTERMRILHTGEVHITSAGAAISPTVKHSGATGDVSKLRLINRSGQSSNKGGALELGGVTNDGVDRSDVFVSIAGLKQNATSGDMQGYLQIGVNNGSALDEVVRVSPAGTLFVSNDIGSHSGGAASYAHNTYNHAAVFGRNSTPDGTVVIEDYDVSSGIGNTVLKCFLRDQDPATSATFIDFADAGGRVGSVTHNDDGGGVSFNTTSDYRLKENVIYTWDATTLLKQLKPAKFNFKRNPAKTVQGFLAHEVSSLVPSSVRGDKDHMMDIGTITDSDNNIVYEGVYEHFCKEGQTWTKTGTEPLYQELDYSRLIPLLTKTVQEQQTVIESLTARITTLEG